MNYVICYNSII